MSLSQKKRLALYSMFGGKCAYCGCDLPEKWHADHIEPVVRDFEWVRVDNHPRGVSHVAKQTGKLLNPENEREDNYFPACIPCNIDKAAMSLDVWRSCLEDRVRVCQDNHSAFRHALRFGLVSIVKNKVVFYFEERRKAGDRND